MPDLSHATRHMKYVKENPSFNNGLANFNWTRRLETTLVKVKEQPQWRAMNKENHLTQYKDSESEQCWMLMD